jgi:DNA polymerase-3 subunit epsilon
MDMQHRPFVFLDIETTGASPAFARITEIGAVRVENGLVVARFSRLVNPEQPVPAFITRLTGITDEMLWEAPSFSAIAAELEDFLTGAVFIAHNVQFDYSFLKAEFDRLQRPFVVDRFCTARLSRRLYPTQRRHNLDTILTVHGISVKNRHRALDDAEALFEFFQSAHKEHGLRVFAEADRLLVRAPARKTIT